MLHCPRKSYIKSSAWQKVEYIMSHEVETMAWANEVPWHRLGYQIGDDATPEQILRCRS